MSARSPGAPILLSGPSGSGKTTIVRRLLERHADLLFSVSATTRPPREGERDGVDYRFLSADEFRELIEAGELLEWAEVHGQLYGTPRSNVRAAAESGRRLLMDVDVQGAGQVRDRVPNALAIFLLPPTGARVVERLRGRGSEDDARLRVRLESALEELGAVSEFDYAVINDDLERAIADVESIIEADPGGRAHVATAALGHAERLAGEIAAAIG